MSNEGGKVSMQGELGDGFPPQMVHVPIYLTGRACLWDGFLLVLTRHCDGEPEALRCWWDSWWEEWTRRSFEPFRRSIFKTYKIILIVVASTLLAAGFRYPSPPCLYLEFCYATSLVLCYILNLWKQLMRRNASYPSDHTRHGSAVNCCSPEDSPGPWFPVQTSVPQVIKTSNESKRHKRNYHFGELSIIAIA